MLTLTVEIDPEGKNSDLALVAWLLEKCALERSGSLLGALEQALWCRQRYGMPDPSDIIVEDVERQ